MRTLASLQFPKPLDIELQPWNIPTNLVHGPLASFTAIRGFEHWLSSLKAWQNLQFGNPPNEMYFWTQGAQSLLSFCAVPLTDASNRMSVATQRILQDGNQWLTTNGLGKFRLPTNTTGVVVWDDLPFLEPKIRTVADDGNEFVLGALGPMPLTNRPVPPELFPQFQGRTNVVIYDWELTGKRLDASQYIAQFFRFILLKPQVPPKSVSLEWFEAIAPKLANCGTIVTFDSPDRLSLVRKSTIGFTSTELQWVVDWLESSRFPLGLNTFTGPPPPPIKPFQKANQAIIPPAKSPPSAAPNP
jgi:hypothetical protein